MRGTADRLVETQAFLRDLEREPFRHDFFQTLAAHRVPVRGQAAAGHAPRSRPTSRCDLGRTCRWRSHRRRSLRSSRARAVEPPRLTQRFFGLLGPNGPLPLHLTDYARERVLHHGDPTLARFFDVFHHRMLALFYRAWAQAQPTASLDRPYDDRFADFVGSLIGIGSPLLRRRDAGRRPRQAVPRRLAGAPGAQRRWAAGAACRVLSRAGAHRALHRALDALA